MDASAILGQYMLKGWVLTDRTCPTAGCSVPLMRSPAARTPVVHFCANCDGGPDTTRPTPSYQVPDSSASVSSSSHLSRSSTPPTEVSSTPSSPVFTLPAETEESRQRREQSDAASSAIGQRLLKGWAMLADECPNVSCFGVPLVRPPKAGGGKDPRKECVICATVYVTEVDWAGRERLIPDESTKSMVTPVTGNKGKAPELDLADPELGALHVETRSSAIPQPFNGPGEPKIIVQRPSPNIYSSGQMSSSMGRLDSIQTALDESAHGLESTLRALSQRLSSLTSEHPDPASIGSVADTISKVVQALSQVKQLQWAERHAGEVV
ncbi:hypothetical protein B0H15DRAFT_104476 [Mycena belliarum]|uniref:Uncharacterized protein n=1 Tax=Mycena belliarum TaxID=1033014 RepID=A0AAD6XQ74_9AGAR|nr:hypothetical protein B0H15DRAFT_104476 [Mycena belliae]